MNKKMETLLILILSVIPLASSLCTEEKSNKTTCEFRFMCTNSLHGINLPLRCRASANHQVIVDVTLREAVDQIDTFLLQADALKFITTLRIISSWHQTNLSILQHMPSLEHLYLIDDHIIKIDGAPFYHLTNLETIDLSHNDLTDIDELFKFDQTNNLKTLSLANNKINEIAGHAFEELRSLISLDLSNNLISDLTVEPFFNLTNLQELRLDNNRIKDLNGAVNNLKNLKHLFLRGNQIQNIDEPSLRVIYHLKTFDLSDNQLDRLKPIVLSRHWYHFKGVCKILLAKNHIKSVHNASSVSVRYMDNQIQFFSLKLRDLMRRQTRGLNVHEVDVLTELDLSNNFIDEIEYNAFLSLVKLTHLDLSYNNLTEFHVNPKHVRYLAYLSLRSNHISSLYDESFSSMTALQHIDLSHNYMHYIPDKTFFANTNLREVNFANNKFEELTNLFIDSFSPTGGILDLSGNNLTRLYIPRGEDIRLTTLQLSSNKICEIMNVNLYHQRELKILTLSRNCIQNLNASSLLLPEHLRILDLSYNQIKDIGPSTFSKYVELEYLNLRENNLQAVDYGALQGLNFLYRLDLSYNKITSLDSKVLMDLKNLQELFLQHNGLYKLNYNIWLGHTNILKVYLEGNNFSCDWLATAIKDFQNGFSKMSPAVYKREESVRNSVENIPCVQKEKKSGSLEILDSEDTYDKKINYVLIDDRLLTINQKILETVRFQTRYLRSISLKLGEHAL